jgi:tellurite resistance protein TehA-like permease
VAGIVVFLKAVLIALLAAFGVMMVHHNVQPDSFGLGVGAFAIVGAFMLYRIWFLRRAT